MSEAYYEKEDDYDGADDSYYEPEVQTEYDTDTIELEDGEFEEFSGWREARQVEAQARAEYEAAEAELDEWAGLLEGIDAEIGRKLSGQEVEEFLMTLESDGAAAAQEYISNLGDDDELRREFMLERVRGQR